MTPGRQSYDNAKAERFMRTLKEEEADGRAYRDIDDARNRIGEFIDAVYDKQRLHSAIDYQSPDEYESGQCDCGGKPCGNLRNGELVTDLCLTRGVHFTMSPV
ncbi:integrase core domain-containing protein [Mesorhizobium sp.]|uniref:integrase core domain-containing protein n=1 Tax=Mesorhizobium sp. TaxID=1871066 RepID=UPI000FE8DB5C|nr:integrase core domain-containing protein [Mesorhizobium sp.]RWP94187.1 MAG: hypothetical protein EOR89_31405 [Mesorhizobium sp.]RWQ45914.1 MAG: hypothetical protein EOS82_23430 [Mesorhizobium sp.]